MITSKPKGVISFLYITVDLHFVNYWCKAIEKVRINFQISY